MIDFGFDKIALIGAVALIVIGPEKLPRVARTVGHFVGKAQRYVADVKAVDDVTTKAKKAAKDLEKSAKASEKSAETKVQAQAKKAKAAVADVLHKASDALEKASQKVAKSGKPVKK